MGRAHHSLILPVLLGAFGITFTIGMLVGWSILFASYWSLANEAPAVVDLGVGFWIALVLGILLLLGVAAAMVLFLVDNVRKRIAVRQQSAFIDSVTHELKSPLASIALCLDTLEMRTVDPAVREKLLGMMRADVVRLRAFIDHVLIAGRLEHQDLPPALEAVDLSPLVARCIEDVCRRHTVPPEAVQTELDVGRVRTDPVALDVVVSNLLDNAIKYGGPDPRVTVRAVACGGWLAIEVQGSGVGIAREDLAKVFRRFYRVERPDQPRVRGTGLGLYVADQLVQKLGGTIRATSEGPGCGATFRVELPLQEVAP